MSAELTPGARLMLDTVAERAAASVLANSSTALTLDAESIEAISQRVAELLRADPTPTPNGGEPSFDPDQSCDLDHKSLVDAATLARHLGCSTEWVYRNSAKLGAYRLGDGKKARLRFDVEQAMAATARLTAPAEAKPPPRRPHAPRPAKGAVDPSSVLAVRSRVK